MKGRDVLSIYRICIETGVPAAIKIVSRVYQQSKEEEAWTKKLKQTNETVAAGPGVPRKKK